MKRCGTFCLCVFLVMGLFALMATPFFPLAYLTLLLLGPIAYGAACLWDKVAAGPAAAGMKRRMARRAHHARAR